MAASMTFASTASSREGTATGAMPTTERNRLAAANPTASPTETPGADVGRARNSTSVAPAEPPRLPATSFSASATRTLRSVASPAKSAGLPVTCAAPGVDGVAAPPSSRRVTAATAQASGAAAGAPGLVPPPSNASKPVAAESAPDAADAMTGTSAAAGAGTVATAGIAVGIAVVNAAGAATAAAGATASAGTVIGAFPPASTAIAGASRRVCSIVSLSAPPPLSGRVRRVAPRSGRPVASGRASGPVSGPESAPASAGAVPRVRRSMALRVPRDAVAPPATLARSEASADPVEVSEPVSAPALAGNARIAPPTPRTTASAPTRPTYLAVLITNPSYGDAALAADEVYHGGRVPQLSLSGLTVRPVWANIRRCPHRIPGRSAGSRCRWPAVAHPRSVRWHR